MKRVPITVLTAFVFSCVLQAQGLIRYGFACEDVVAYNPAAESRGVLIGRSGNTLAVFSNYRFCSGDCFAESLMDSEIFFNSVTDKGTISFGLSYDGYSFFDNHTFFGRVSRSASLKNGGEISFGSGLSIVEDEIHLDQLVFPRGTGTVSRLRPDIDLGCEYRKDGWRLGAAVKNLLSLKARVDGYGFVQYPRSVLLNASKDCLIGSGWTITPFFFGGYIQGLSGDFGARLSKNDSFFVTYAFRTMDLCNIISAGAAFSDFISAGLSLDCSTEHSSSTLGALISFRF